MNYETSETRAVNDLPGSLWIPRGGFRIFRGTPSEIVVEMAHDDDEPQSLSVRESLEQLTNGLRSAKRLIIQLPWEESDEVCSALFLQALMHLGITKPTPTA